MLFNLTDRTISLSKYQPSETVGQIKMFNEKPSTFFTGISEARSLSEILIKENLDTGKDNSIIFGGTNMVDLQFEMGLGVATGLTSATMYPWYVKPCSIRVDGVCELSNFQMLSKTDKTIGNVFSFLMYYLRERQTKRDIMKLKVANNPSGTYQETSEADAIIASTEYFKGYITRFGFKENLNSPFILEYSLSFEGSPIFDGNQLQAIPKKVKTDLSVSAIVSSYMKEVMARIRSYES